MDRVHANFVEGHQLGEPTVAHGVGAYIQTNTVAGAYPKIVLGIVMLSLFVTIFNRALWRLLYRQSERRLRLD